MRLYDFFDGLRVIAVIELVLWAFKKNTNSRFKDNSLIFSFFLAKKRMNTDNLIFSQISPNCFFSLWIKEKHIFSPDRENQASTNGYQIRVVIHPDSDPLAIL